jgi:hypothetical protein
MQSKQANQNSGCRSRLGCFLRILLFLAIGFGLGAFVVSHDLSCAPVNAACDWQDYAIAFDEDCHSHITFIPDPYMGDLGSSLDSGFLWAVVKIDESWTAWSGIIGQGYSGKSTFWLEINSPGAGDVRAYIRDKDGKILSGYVEAGINNGLWMYIDLYWNCASNSISLACYDYDTQEIGSDTVIYEYQQTPANFSNFEHPVTIGERREGDSTTCSLTGDISEIQFGGSGDNYGCWYFWEGQGIVTLDSCTAPGYTGLLFNCEWAPGYEWEEPEPEPEPLYLDDLIDYLTTNNYTTMAEILALNYMDLEGIEAWLASQNYTTLQAVEAWIEAWAAENNLTGGIGMPLWYLFGLAALAAGAWWSRSMLVNIMVAAMAGAGFPLVESTLEAGSATYWGVYLVLILAVVYALIQIFTRVEHW